MQVKRKCAEGELLQIAKSPKLISLEEKFIIRYPSKTLPKWLPCCAVGASIQDSTRRNNSENAGIRREVGMAIPDQR